MNSPIVVAITGASGVVYAVRLLEALQAAGRDVQFSISPAGATVIQQELGFHLDLNDFSPGQLWPEEKPVFGHLPATRGHDAVGAEQAVFRPIRLQYYHFGDFLAPIASGSALTDGMAICPCSGGTLSAVVTGASNNLIQRAANVHLKERRRLILVPRETPLSQVELANMLRASELGAVVLPAMPGWYHGVRSAADLVDFIVGRILDQLRVEHRLISRWGAGVQEDD